MTAKRPDPAPDRMPDPTRDGNVCRLLVEQSRGHAIMLIDTEGKIRYWTPGAERIFGHTRAQALGQPFSMLFIPEDCERGIPELELKIAASDTSSEDDRWHLRADGARFWSSGTLDCLHDAQGNVIGYVKILRDRTTIREQVELLTNRLNAAIEERDRQETFVTTLAHELRNLILTLSHGLRLMQAPEGKAHAPPKEKLVRLMQDQVQLVKRMTDDLLDAERLKTGKLSLQFSRVVLQDLLSRALELLHVKIATRQLQVQLLEPGWPIAVRGDPDRLVQVFGNLLDNAVKYTPDGGRIWIKVTVEDPHAVVHIEDTGIGIPPDMLPRIFDLFTQASTHVSNQGLGIGLALVRDLVAVHNGSVQARSEGLGHGSEFSVRLRLAEEQRAKQPHAP